MKFKVVKSEPPLEYMFIFPNNYTKLSTKYPGIVNPETIEKASARFGTKKENLVVVPGNECEGGQRVISWVMLGDRYTLIQENAVLMDGASSPVRIGDIGNFAPNLVRAWFVHDALYALFHKVPRKTCDRIFTCFAEADGTNRLARMVMMTALRLFGGKARRLAPRNHWNYRRIRLFINEVEIYE